MKYIPKQIKKVNHDELNIEGQKIKIKSKERTAKKKKLNKPRLMIGATPCAEKILTRH